MALPDIDSLRCFSAAARHLNFRVAAKSVALSPGAFSGRIARLEETLGVSLFERTTRRVVLSPEGTRLWGHVEQVLEGARRCSSVAKSAEAKPPFALTIGTRFELGLSWLTPSLEALARARPDRTLHLTFGDSPDLIERARLGLIDGAVTSARFTSRALRFRVLHEEGYVFVASRSLLRRKPLRNAEDATGHVLLDLSADLPLFRYFLDAQRAARVWAFARTELLGTIAAVRFRLLEGAGVGVLPRYFATPDLKAGRLVQLQPRVKLAEDFFRLIWREGHPREDELIALASDLATRPLR